MNPDFPRLEGVRADRMAPISFNSLLITAGISVLVPVVLGLLPGLPVPGSAGRTPPVRPGPRLDPNPRI
jgi:hypothetical protein